MQLKDGLVLKPTRLTSNLRTPKPGSVCNRCLATCQDALQSAALTEYAMHPSTSQTENLIYVYVPLLTCAAVALAALTTCAKATSASQAAREAIHGILELSNAKQTTLGLPAWQPVDGCPI